MSAIDHRWPVDASEMAGRIRGFDWSQTPLGAIAGWPQSLKTAVDLVLATRFPASLAWGRDLTICAYNDSYRTLLGDKPEALARPFPDVWPEVAATIAPQLREALDGHATFREDADFTLDRFGAPQQAWFDYCFSPVRDETGAVAGVLNTAVETTARHRTALRDRQQQHALRESEARYRALLEGIPQLVWRAKESGEWTWASPQWVRQTGQRVAESQGLGWLEMVHPDDRDAALQAWRTAGPDDFEASYRIWDLEANRYRWYQARACRVHADDEQTVEWLGTSTDVDEIVRLREHERLLLGELQHRVRNTLAVVRTIARRTAEASHSVADFAMHLDGRIDALARVQTAITRDPSGGIDLAAMVADEFLAAVAHEDGKVEISGPPVRLHARAAEAIGLALHELTTNAIKHGALDVDRGRIGISWRLEGEGPARRLVLDWQEHGVPAAVPGPPGFGTNLLDRGLAYQLKAEVTRRIGTDGLHCTITLPATDRILVGAGA